MVDASRIMRLHKYRYREPLIRIQVKQWVVLAVSTQDFAIQYRCPKESFDIFKLVFL